MRVFSVFAKTADARYMTFFH